MPGPVIPAEGDWQRHGLCVGDEPEAFSRPGGGPGAKARGICSACPVREQCLGYAIRADEFGIWGGLDQRERWNLRKRRRRLRAQIAANTRWSSALPGEPVTSPGRPA